MKRGSKNNNDKDRHKIQPKKTPTPNIQLIEDFKSRYRKALLIDWRLVIGYSPKNHELPSDTPLVPILQHSSAYLDATPVIDPAKNIE